MNEKSEPVLILGGYGTFGSRIAKALCAKGHQVIINGRNENKARALCQAIKTQHPHANVLVACFDVNTSLASALSQLSPKVVIHTCGPFQGQDTQVAAAVIDAGIHYIDLADGRDYVQQLLKLDHCAKEKQVTAITAASTVPALSSAALTYLKNQFHIVEFEQVKMGITPGQKTDRGLATTQAVLSYIGKVMKPWPGGGIKRYGWQNTYVQKYPTIGSRMMGNCEAPDLDLLGDYFAIKTLTFSAGMESKLLHVLIWLASWLVKLRLPLNLRKHAFQLLKISRWFDVLGTGDGGMHVMVRGRTNQHQVITKTWVIEAFDFDGPQIPAIPAVLMTEKILSQQMATGAMPCLNLITLDEYLAALSDEKIKTSIS